MQLSFKSRVAGAPVRMARAGKASSKAAPLAQRVVTPKAVLSESPVGKTAANGGNPDLDASRFLRKMGTILSDYIENAGDRDEPVIRLRSPDELTEIFKETGVGINMVEGDGPKTEDELLAACQAVLDYSVNTGHPLFYNQLFARSDPVAIAAEWLVAANNSSVYTYEVAPVFSLMEKEVIDRMAKFLGPTFSKEADGLFVPGGSIANLYSIHIARNRYDPNLRTRGAAGGPRLVAFCSEHAHYSYKKSAIVLGLGLDNMVQVECDEGGRMIPEKLEEAIEAAKADGGVPFYIGGTAASTVMGAIDDVAALGKVAKKHDLWLHVDGAWGGSSLFSSTHRHLLDGIDGVDSMTWNAHKMMGVPLQCSAFLCRHANVLQEVNGLNAAYLFQKDKLYANLDCGDRTIQCGRHIDVFKFWLTWKAYGDAGLELRVNHAFSRATMWEEMTKTYEGEGKFVMVAPRSFTNVCFWYVPPSMSHIDPHNPSEEEWKQLHEVAVVVKERMQNAGDAMIGFQSIFGKPNFFRLVFSSSINGDLEVTEDDLVDLMKRMDDFGKDL